MTMGTGVALFVIGAILAFAVRIGNGFISLSTVGYILMAAGVVVFVIGLITTLVGRRTVSTTRSTIDPSTGDRVVRGTSSTTRDL